MNHSNTFSILRKKLTEYRQANGGNPAEISLTHEERLELLADTRTLGRYDRDHRGKETFEGVDVVVGEHLKLLP